MNIAFLVVIMVAIVIGVNLIAPVASAVEEGEASGLVNILAIIFVAVIILGAVAWMGYSGKKTTEEGISNKAATNIKSYIKEHKKLCLAILIAGVTMLLLQLSTYV